MPWEPNEQAGRGITWVELLALYELAGYNWEGTKEQEQNRLVKAKKSGCKDIERGSIRSQRGAA